MRDGVYVVTGATSGIGAAVAAALRAQNAAVVTVSRTGDVALDLAAADAPERLAAALSSHGPVGGFVHCAGTDELAPLGQVTAAMAARLYALHVIFPMRFLGWLGRRTNHVANAGAVLVSSTAADEPVPGNAAYAAVKGAVRSLAITARAELAPRGVRVSCVAFGPVDTPMARNSWLAALPAAQRTAAVVKLMSPARAAAEILSLL
ncbi:MAG: SDR family NAD(P)-dependent oxidoreductase [Kiritimatiellia bacterium]